MTIDDRVELDLTEADYDFTISAGIVFLILEGLNLYYLITVHKRINDLYHFVLLVLMVSMFITALIQKRETLEPVTFGFFNKYKIPIPRL